MRSEVVVGVGGEGAALPLPADSQAFLSRGSSALLILVIQPAVTPPCSVVDPNILNLDTDQEFLPTLDPDPDPGLCYKF